MIDTETARTKNVRAVLAKRQIFFVRLKKRGADRYLFRRCKYDELYNKRYSSSERIIFLGIFICIAVNVLLYLFKKRRNFSQKCILEAIFCIYCVTLARLTGIFSPLKTLIGFCILPTKTFYIGVIRVIRIVWTIPKRMENYRLIKKKY